MESSLGSTLADYQVIGLIGRGAYSYVYHVRSHHSPIDLALKVVDKARVKEATQLSRLKNEIDLQMTLEHRHVVSLLHHFEDENHFFLVMEYCPGGSLHAFIGKEGRLSEEETRLLCGQLLQGLEYLHSLQIMHRDLKLANLFLSDDKTELRIGDFGLAVQLSTAQDSHSTFCGTPNYMAPEIVNHLTYDARTDLFSFGCIVFACLTGSPPFESQKVEDTLKKVSKIEYEIPEYCSGEAKDLIKRLLSKSDVRISLEEVKSHGFFRRFIAQDAPTLFIDYQPPKQLTIDEDCSYCEYSEPLVSPINQMAGRQDYSVLKETTRYADNKQPDLDKPTKAYTDNPPAKPSSKQIEPLTTYNLGPCRFQLRKGHLEVKSSGTLYVSLGVKHLKISSDGTSIIYKDRRYSLRTTNKSVRSLYDYARVCLDVIRSKTVKVRHQDDKAEYMLMWNSPNPNFEVDFKDGMRIVYRVGSGAMTLHTFMGKAVQIDPYCAVTDSIEDVSWRVNLAMEGLKECLAKEKEFC
jgi:serine/threonine protein kinase